MATTQMPQSESPECQCICDGSQCVCTVCGRRYNTPNRRVRAYCVSANVTVAIIRGGPGTELKALLKTIGIFAKPSCSCNKRAQVMDMNGCDWCEANIDQIDGWLAEEAKKRKLPYISLAGKTLIKLAIRRARKKGNSR